MTEAQNEQIIDREREGLVEFLYLLARDHIPTGVIRGIITAHLQHEPRAKRYFSDPDLEEWARKRADEISSVSLHPKADRTVSL